MPRKSTSKAATTPKAAPAEDTPSRRSGLRTPTAKQAAKEPASTASEPKRSRRSSTAAQTAASQAESKKTRSQSPDDDSNADRSSPTSRAVRRPMRKVNYEESDGEEENAAKPVGKEDEYNADEDVENDSDSLESTSKKKGKVKSPPVPSTPRNSRGRGQNTATPKASRSHKKKVVYEEVERDSDEDVPAAPTPSGRRARQSSEKANQEEEKPKGTSRSRRAAAAASPAPASARPSRAARQRKSASTEEKVETSKPVRSSTRNRKKVEQQEEEEEDENEEMDEEAEQKEEVEEPETKGEKEESKKRKLDHAEGEKDEEDHKVKKAKVEKDNEAPSKSSKSDNDEGKEEEEAEEKEGNEEEPMEVDSKEDLESESAPTDDKKGDEVVENEKEPEEEEDEEEDEAQEVEEAETATEDKTEVEDAKEKEQTEKELDEEEEGEEEEEQEEEECEEPIEDSEPKASEKELEESESSEKLSTPANQNSPVPKQSPTKQSSLTPGASAEASKEPAAAVTEKLANSIPVVSDSLKATNCESFQGSPVKDSVNGASPEDVAKSNASKSEPTQMLPSSAIELNQQQLVSSKPESDTVRVSANGHVTDEKSSVDATTNDCSSGLLRGRPYFPNRSPCVEALSRHRERTFGLVSLNLESTKVDDKFCLELKSFVSDIVCVQGVSQEHFAEQLEPCLNALGYKGTFAQDENLPVATFYRSSIFQLKSQKKLTLKQTITKDLERNMTPGEVSVVVEKIPLCGQVLFTHLGLTQSTRAVVIANVLVPPSDVSIQALQMSCLAREAVSFVESGGTGSGVPLIFCGAFNMEQQEAAYQLLRDGYLSNEMIEALQSKKELKLPGRDEDTSLVNLLWKSFQHSTSGLKSCYSAVTGKEIAVGGQDSVRTSPDLIWFTSDSLTPIGVLEAPSNPTGHHLLLKANLAFNY